MNPTRYFLLILTALSLFAPNARAAFSAIGVGTSANDGTGDTLRAAFVKVNDNFDLSVLNSAGSATNLTIVGGSFSAITNTTLTASKPVFSAADKSLTSTGTVPVDQGGTGLTAWTLNGIPYASATGTLASGTGLTFDGTTLTVDANLAFNGPQTISTSSGALTITPASGSGLLVNLATTGDFAVNTDDLYADTSSGFIGIGTAAPRTFLSVTSGTENSAGSLPPSLALLTGPGPAPRTDGGGAEAMLSLMSNDDMAINKGGSIMFGGRYATGSEASSGFASIFGAKQNGSSGDLAGYLSFWTNESAVQTEQMRISDAGNVGLNTITGAARLSINGGAHVGGDSDPGDNNLAVDGTSTLTGAVTHTTTTIYTSASIQTLAAGSPVAASATKVIVAGSGGAVTTTAAPSIADGTDGQMLYVVGTNDTNTLELQDEGTLASSNLALGSTSRVLGLGDVLVLMYDTTTASWIEVSFTNN
jgi:hypothetical protein